MASYRGTPDPGPLAEFDHRLSPAEKEEARSAKVVVILRMESQKEHILRDRKLMLRFLRAVMGDDGVCAIDELSQLFWSRRALDEELLHDADLDIDQIYCVHAVTPDTGKRVECLHSHGLAEIGRFDFDVLFPSDDLLGVANELL